MSGCVFVRNTMCAVLQVASALHQCTLGAQPSPASQVGTSVSEQSAQAGGTLDNIIPANDFSWIISVTFYLRSSSRQSFDVNDLWCVPQMMSLDSKGQPDMEEGTKMEKVGKIRPFLLFLCWGGF